MGNTWEVDNTGRMKLKSFSSDPSGTEGMVIYNSTDKAMKVYNGTEWKKAGMVELYSNDWDTGPYWHDDITRPHRGYITWKMWIPVKACPLIVGTGLEDTGDIWYAKITSPAYSFHTYEYNANNTTYDDSNDMHIYIGYSIIDENTQTDLYIKEDRYATFTLGQCKCLYDEVGACSYTLEGKHENGSFTNDYNQNPVTYYSGMTYTFSSGDITNIETDDENGPTVGNSSTFPGGTGYVFNYSWVVLKMTSFSLYNSAHDRIRFVGSVRTTKSTYYGGSTVPFYIWNFNTTSWDSLTNYNLGTNMHNGIFHTIATDDIDPTDYISGGVVYILIHLPFNRTGGSQNYQHSNQLWFWKVYSGYSMPREVYDLI